MADTIKYEGPTGVLVEEGMSYSRSYTCVDEENMLVEVCHVSRCKDGRDVYVKNTFDYSSMDVGSRLETASRTSVIASRGPEFRKVSSMEAIATLEGKTLNAGDYFKRERKGKSFEDKVAELVAGGIPEDTAKLMLTDPVKAYQEMMKASK